MPPNSPHKHTSINIKQTCIMPHSLFCIRNPVFAHKPGASSFLVILNAAALVPLPPTFGHLICISFADPLVAMIKAQAASGQKTLEFIKTVGFDDNNNAKMFQFTYRSTNESGVLDSTSFQIPVLSIIPIPYIRVRVPVCVCVSVSVCV